MRGNDDVLIPRFRFGERSFAKREQAGRERNAERYGDLYVRNGCPFVRNRFLFGRIRSVSRALVRCRRVRQYRAVTRVFDRDFPDSDAELALFRNPGTVHLRL